MAAPKHSVRQFLLPVFDVVANGFLNVPAMEQKSVSWAWRPGGTDFGGGLGGDAYPTGPACLGALTSHMHKRGPLVTIESLDCSTAVECAGNGTTCRTAW